MTDWNIDDNEIKSFEFKGWCVKVHPGWGAPTFDVSPPKESSEYNILHEVNVENSGLWVRGSYYTGYSEGPSSFTIPWEVLEAIMEARKESRK